MQTSITTKQNKPVSSLTRRLMAMFYDFLLLLGVLFAVSACAVAINHGQAVTHPVYYLTLLATTFVFYGWFWTHGGQTLGMRTWKVQIITDKGEDVAWKQAAVRFAAAIVALLPAGIGLLWMLFDRDKLAWHDKLSATRLISLKVDKKSIATDDANAESEATNSD